MIQLIMGILLMFNAVVMIAYFGNRKKYKDALERYHREGYKGVRLCKNCTRVYGYHRNDYVDQCEVPCCGLNGNSIATVSLPRSDFKKALYGEESDNTDDEGAKFLKTHLEYIHLASNNKVYGKPSLMNIDNDCYFYLPERSGIPFLMKLKIFLSSADEAKEKCKMKIKRLYTEGDCEGRSQRTVGYFTGTLSQIITYCIKRDINPMYAFHIEEIDVIDTVNVCPGVSATIGEYGRVEYQTTAELEKTRKKNRALKKLTPEERRLLNLTDEISD